MFHSDKSYMWLQMDHLGSWLALAAPLERLDVAAAAAAVRKYGDVADEHWAARWAELAAAVADADTTMPTGADSSS